MTFKFKVIFNSIFYGIASFMSFIGGYFLASLPAFQYYKVFTQNDLGRILILGPDLFGTIILLCMALFGDRKNLKFALSAILICNSMLLGAVFNLLS